MDAAAALAFVSALAPACKEHGIRRLRVGELELELGGGQVDAAAVKAFQGLIDKGLPTDEEALFWSSAVREDG